MADHNLEFLKSKPEDESFHRSRIMFCIKDGKVEIAPRDITDSHLEWFVKEGWITKKNAEEFLKRNVRGFYLPRTNKLYCYRGVGFSFDEGVLPEVLNKIDDFKKVFNLNDETEIHLGPKDSAIYGREYPRVCVGKLKDIMNTGR